jgi:hypothetical protein
MATAVALVLLSISQTSNAGLAATMALINQNNLSEASAITSSMGAHEDNKEVGYAYGTSGGHLLNNGIIARFNDSDRVNFTVASSPQGGSSL